MNTQQAITVASQHLSNLSGTVFDDLILTKPDNADAAVNLGKIVSKLSPLVGNLIEFNTVEFLNSIDAFKPFGHWKRQDPEFPDAIFDGTITPAPGFEIKAWFPLATEITARFKDSQNHFQYDQTYVAMLAWLPENLIYGRPKIVDIVIVPALSVAASRDNHYHNPPDYLVLEPEDTTQRTRNLQQSNTNGFKFQGSKTDFERAQRIVRSWGADGKTYQPTQAYQDQLRELTSQFKYRLDTNFAKMDRIVHPEIEAFKSKVYQTRFMGLSINDWKRTLSSKDDQRIQNSLAQHTDII